jgi:hypothetical protein
MRMFFLTGIVAFALGLSLGAPRLVTALRGGQPPVNSVDSVNPIPEAVPIGDAVATPTARDRCYACVSDAVRDQYEHPQWSRHLVPTGARHVL